MSIKLNINKALENYSPQEFADFVSENGFPECKDYIIETQMTYSKFVNTPEFEFRTGMSITFSNFSKFCKFHKKLKVSPEECNQIIVTFTDNIQTITEQANYQDERKPKPLLTKPNIVPKPGIPSKPIGLIKPEIAQKLNLINNHIHVRHNRSSSVGERNSITPNKAQFHRTPLQDQISHELKAKLNIVAPKNLPLPPDIVNISEVPSLPDYFELNSRYPRKQLSADDIFNYDPDDDDKKEEASYNTPPDEEFEDEDSTYFEPDVAEETYDHPVHVSSPVPVPVPPKVDRDMKPMHIHHDNNRLESQKPITRISSIGDDDDDAMHMYEELSLSPSTKDNHPRQNAYSTYPTGSAKRSVSRHNSLDVEYLKPREATSPIQTNVEHNRPLPPTPEQEYTLDYLKTETYFRDVDRKSAEKILQTEPIGIFLVRPSRKYFCCLTIKAPSTIFHVATVKLEGNKFHLKVDSPLDLKKFHSITDLINYYIEHGVSIPHGDKVTCVKLINDL